MSRTTWSDRPKAVSRGSHVSDSVLFWLSLTTFLAFALRTLRIDFQPLWWDEGWSLYFATADIPSMISRTAIDIHPPFYYLLLNGWVLICGSTAASVRLLSALIGTLSVPLVFLLGRRLFGVRVGVIAGLTLAVAPFHIYYSQETRMYALVTLLVVASMYLFVSLLERRSSAFPALVHWLLYVVVTSLAMYTQYYAAFIPISQSIFLLIRIRRYKPLLLKWLGAQIALLFSYLPWLLYAGRKLVEYVATKLVKESDMPLGLAAYVKQHLLAFSVGHVSDARAYLGWLAVIFIALAALGIVVYIRYRPQAEGVCGHPRHAIALTVIYLAVPVFLGYVINLRYPFMSPGIERLFLLSAPAFFILAAVGLTWLWERWGLVWLACVLLLAVNSMPLFDFYTVERYAMEDYRPLIEKVQALARPDDVIVAVHPWQIGYFHAYYVGQLPSLYLTPKETGDVTREEWAEEPARMAQELDRLLVEHRFLWLPTHQSLGRILENDMEGYLSQRYYPLLNQWFAESTKLSSYTAGVETSLIEKETNFGDKVTLAGYGFSSKPMEAGWSALPVELRWRVSGQLEGRYQVALRLVDEQGQAWAAQDSEPVGGLRPFHEQPVGSQMADRHGLPIPAGTPPGSYELRLGLYRLQDGQWLDILDHNASPRGVEAALGPVDVVVPGSPPPTLALSIQYPRQADFVPGLRLLGYSLASESPRPGDTLEISLFWQALADLQDDYHVSLQLQDEGGRSLVSTEGPLGNGNYPTSAWRQGQLVRDPRSLAIPGRLAGGDYRLRLALYRPGDRRPLSLRRWGLNCGDSYVLGTISLHGRSHEMEPPASIGHAMALRLGESVQFLGYDVDRQIVSPGDSLHLTLYWRALAEVDTSYTVFTHLTDDQGQIWGQRDSIPGQGTLPTSSWLPGEYITDEYEIAVRVDAPPGQYAIEIGMYELATMIRLPVFDAQGTGVGDRILLEDTPISVGP